MITRTRRHPLLVFPPGIIVGIDPFVAEAAEIDPGEPGGVALAIAGGIENIWVGAHAIITGSRCHWHNDGWYAADPHYYALLVVRNDANSWVETREKQKQREQPIGTLVLLDITREHRLTCAKPTPPKALWVALVIDYVEVPEPGTCIIDMRALVAKAREEQES